MRIVTNRLTVVICTVMLFAGSARAQYCDFLGRDSLFVTINDDTVNLWDIAACGYCSSVFATSVTSSSDSILVVQTDTVSRKTLCDCLFNLKLGISGLLPGSYTAFVYRQKLKRFGYPSDTLQFVGRMVFQFQPDVWGTLHVVSYQSPCTLNNSVREPVSSLPSHVILEQTYPNPFNPATTIQYALPQRLHVTLTVFNTLGQQVATLVDVMEEPGEHRVRFDWSGLASGVYLYRLAAENNVVTKKLVILR